jgi:hypothetical protein
MDKPEENLTVTNYRQTFKEIFDESFTQDTELKSKFADISAKITQHFQENDEEEKQKTFN